MATGNGGRVLRMENEFPIALQGLLRESAYPHPVHGLRLITSHISWVLLTGELAYKIKRPVVFPFVDLSSRERRAFLCHEELRLNRRFAPELYLEVCPVTVAGGEARIGGTGDVVEHAVKMRQFPQEEQLDRLLAESRIEPVELAAFGRSLASAHRGLPAADGTQAWGQPAAVRAVMLENLEQCAEAARRLCGERAVLSLREALRARIESSMEWMSRRLKSGKVRECHGDLHTGNVVRSGPTLVPFDCLEFDPALRWIDVADEVAFLLADLEARARPLHAQAFLGGYLEESGDFEACRVIELYKAHRSLVRAKVVALSSREAGSFDGRRYAAHIDCARAALQAKKPLMILMAGLSGTGKTWLAERIAPALNAVHLRSDIERKRLAGMTAMQRSESALGEGLYSPHADEATYTHLARCARDVLAGGFTVIVDATFRPREHREAFGKLAAELGLRIRLIYCHAPQDVLEGRIAERTRRSYDPSEADVSVMRWQSNHFEAIERTEPLTVIPVSTQETGIVDRVLLELRSSP